MWYEKHFDKGKEVLLTGLELERICELRKKHSKHATDMARD